MYRVPQFVSQGGDVSQGACEIKQDIRISTRIEPHAEGAARLTGAWCSIKASGCN